MKKIILAALIVVSASFSAMANDNINTTTASNLVKKDFPAATDITYKEAKDYTVVSFAVNSQRMQAFYDNNGVKIGTSRTIQLKELPGDAAAVIAAQYAAYTATEAIEMKSEADGTSYFVHLQNNQQKMILQIDTDGDISVFKK